MRRCWSRPAWSTTLSLATGGPPWRLSRRRRGACLGAGEVLPLPWLGCLAAPGLTPRRFGGAHAPRCHCCARCRSSPQRRGASCLPWPMAVMPASSRVVLPPRLPSRPAMRPAFGRLPGAWRGRAPWPLPPLRAPVRRSAGAPLGASLRSLRPLLLRWRRLRPSAMPAPMPTCRLLAPIRPRTMMGLPRPRTRRTLRTRRASGPRAPLASCGSRLPRPRRSYAWPSRRALPLAWVPPGLMLPMLRPLWPLRWHVLATIL